jgi:hypothetical protein
MLVVLARTRAPGTVPKVVSRCVRFAIVVLVSFAALGAGCSAEQPRGGDIRGMIDDIWEAAGMPSDVVDVFEYKRDRMPGDARCERVQREDRWMASRGSSVPPGHANPTAIREDIVELLEREGFDVSVYRAAHARSEVRKVQATRDEMVVDATFNPDGATSVRVYAGPCAPLVVDVADSDRYVLES